MTVDDAVMTVRAEVHMLGWQDRYKSHRDSRDNSERSTYASGAAVHWQMPAIRRKYRPYVKCQGWIRCESSIQRRVGAAGSVCDGLHMRVVAQRVLDEPRHHDEEREQPRGR